MPVFLTKRKTRNLLAVITVVLVGLGLWAFWIEPAWVTVRQVSLEVPQWHAEHQDMRIVVLTDLHVGAPHLEAV